jgi:hypothetical protein
MLNEAIRSLRRAPTFSLITMTALAIGMGGPIAVVHIFRWPRPHAGGSMEPIVLTVLSIAVAAVCANVASLHLARGDGRRREIEIRFALGADCGRIFRQLITESLLLALGGGVGAVWVGHIGANVIADWTLMPGAVVRTDLPIMLLAAALALATGVASGLGPSLRIARRRTRRPRRRRVLIGLTASAGCFFLIAGGVYTKWTRFLLHPPLRFAVERTFEIRPASPDQLRATLESLRRDPAIEAATISGVSLGRSLQLRWLDSRKGVSVNGVDPSYFAFMGSKLLRGRIFDLNQPYSMVVGQSAARELWPGMDPLGKKLRLHWYDDSTAEYDVVGVCEDTGESRLMPGPRRVEIFIPLEQRQLGLAVVLARTRPGAAFRWNQTAVPLTRVLARARAYNTQYSALMDFMGAVITVVSALGLAGVLWCAVVQRARDVAIRVALGARRRDILRVLATEFLTPLSAGVGIGVVLGAEFWLYTGIYLDGVTRFDPATYLGAIGLFAGIGLVGAGFAGARAWKVAPAAMLKRV